MIKIQHLSKSFGSHQVLADITLQVPKGQVVAVIGPSGSGKSTLLRCMNRLEDPTAGTVEIDGVLLTAPGCKIARVRQKIGMVFQNFHLFPHKTALENLVYAPMKVKGISREKAEEKARALLKRVNLSDKAEAYPAKLSGGQKQRVAIARALAMEPETLLFDEPTSALDPEMVKEVLDVIKGLAHTGITMVIVTHEMRFARDVADRILFLADGQLVEDSKPGTFFAKPASERARAFLEKVL